MRNRSTFDCDCDKMCSIGKYLNSNNCTCIESVAENLAMKRRDEPQSLKNKICGKN